MAFSAGSVMGFTVVGLGLLDLSVWYLILRFFYTVIDPVETEELLIENITSNMLTFGMGASSMALFARVGGGIFTKAADVGADLVGKVERASRKMIRETLQSSPTMWETMWVMWPAWEQICTNRTWVPWYPRLLWPWRRDLA